MMHNKTHRINWHPLW